MIISAPPRSLATTFGIFAARASTRTPFSGQGAASSADHAAPCATREDCLDVASVVLLAVGVELSFLTVILGHVLICTPFAVAILSRPSIASTNRWKRRRTTLAKGRFRRSG